MNNDANEVKLRLNVVDVLGEYLRLEKAGSNWRALCPFHNEKSPSFMVNEERQFWHCFGCQKSGDIFNFVMEMEGVEFPEALKILAEKAGVKLSGYDPKKTESKNRTLEILELATKWYEHQLWQGPGKTKILDYLKKRGLADETIREFRLGYAPKGWRNILAFLTKRGYETKEIAKTGLLVEKKDSRDFYDRFRERIMFPIADYSGRVLGYSARVVPGGDESQAKYVNTPETEVYHKSRVLYGIDKAKSQIKKENFALLVEGNMDVIASYQAGMKNTVAVSGTALTSEQVDIVKRYAPKIKMFFDMDPAGEAATKKSLKMCFGKDLEAEVVVLSEGKDAADMARENPKKLRQAVENSRLAMEYILSRSVSKHDKTQAEGKKKIVEEALEIIGSLAGTVEKSHWIKRLSEIVDVSEDALTNMLKEVTLRERVSLEKNAGSDKELVVVKEKQEILVEELLGLCFSFPEVWQEASRNEEIPGLFGKDRLFETAFRRGKETRFIFEKFLDILDEENKRRAEKIYFQKKYRLGLNNSLEESLSGDVQKDLREAIAGLKMEKRKKDLERITNDLKVAEERNDKKTINLLKMEFKRISDEFAELFSI